MDFETRVEGAFFICLAGFRRHHGEIDRICAKQLTF